MTSPADNVVTRGQPVFNGRRRRNTIEYLMALADTHELAFGGHGAGGFRRPSSTRPR